MSKKREGVGRKVASPLPPTAYFSHLSSFPPVRERLEKESKRLLRRLVRKVSPESAKDKTKLH